MAENLEVKVLRVVRDHLDMVADAVDDPHKGRLTMCVELLDAVLPVEANGPSAAGEEKA